MNKNLKAFLTMIAESEGTNYGTDNGYNLLFGSTEKRPLYFTSYKDHPRIFKTFGNGKKSSAAGRYQILARIYDYYKNLLQLPDFSPESQDKIAIQMIKECKAMPLIESGNLAGAVKACNHIWASLTGAGYGQHEHDLDTLTDFYVEAGGTLLG